MTRVLQLARRGALALALMLACMGSPGSASAADAQIEWHAPPECPDRAAFVSRVNRLLGNSMQSNLRAVTDVTRTTHGYRAQLRTVASATGSGERVLEHARCDMLADSVAVVIALTVATPRDALGNAEVAHLRVAGEALVSTLFGTLPKPAFGIGAGLALELPSLRFELRGAFYLPQSATFAGMQLGATFNAVSFAARGCWLTSVGPFQLGPCVGIDVYHVRASGFGSEAEVVTVSGRETSWAPALGAFGRLRLARAFGIVIVAEAAMPTSRHRFVFADVGPLHRASLIAAQLLIAPEVQF